MKVWVITAVNSYRFSDIIQCSTKVFSNFETAKQELEKMLCKLLPYYDNHISEPDHNRFKCVDSKGNSIDCILQEREVYSVEEI